MELILIYCCFNLNTLSFSLVVFYRILTQNIINYIIKIKIIKIL